MTFTSLASSSRGNAYVVSLECGLSFKELQKRLGYGIAGITACLVSHEHQDHAKAAAQLLKSGVPRDAKAMKAIGYKEMIPYALGETTLDEAVYALKLNTRHYAKRQLTWMRREEDVLWVDALEPDAYDKLEAYYTQGEAK